jgi:predicted restriction endonuclease
MRRTDRRRFFTARQARQLFIAADGKCQQCGCDLVGQPFHAHHIRPHSQGGPIELYNGQILCPPCHGETT